MYHSSLGLRVIKKKKTTVSRKEEGSAEADVVLAHLMQHLRMEVDKSTKLTTLDGSGQVD